MKDKCLICYRILKQKEKIYHLNCASEFFGTKQPPQFDFDLNDINELAKKVVRSQVTIPGVQAKISLDLDKAKSKDSRFTIVGLWGRFILKPPVNHYPAMPEIEHLTMRMAKEIGINTVPHALIRFKSGELAYLSRRIDRPDSGEKIHMEDMCQLTNRMTDDKYKGSMEKIGQYIRNNCSNSMLDVIRFFEVALFSFITGNADMHLKNFSIWYPQKNSIELTPAYDMLSTRLLIPVSQDPEEMALTVNGKKKDIKKKDFVALGDRIGLKQKQIENTFSRITNAREKMLELIRLSFLKDEIKKEYAELIQSRMGRF